MVPRPEMNWLAKRRRKAVLRRRGPMSRSMQRCRSGDRGEQTSHCHAPWIEATYPWWTMNSPLAHGTTHDHRTVQGSQEGSHRLHRAQVREADAVAGTMSEH